MKKLLKLLSELKHFISLKWTMKPRKWTEKDLIPQWNIYEPQLNNRDLTKKFRFFNYIIKYRLVVPFLLFVEKALNKFNMKDVPDYPYNVNLKIFDKAYNKSMKIWIEQYLGERAIPDRIKKRYEGFSGRMLKTCRDLVISGALYDTAYREFLNILMHNITNEMCKEYQGKKNVNHLFYTGNNCYNVYYHAIFQLFQGKGTQQAEIKTKNLSTGTGLIFPDKKKDESKESNKPNNSRDEKENAKKV